MQIYIEEYGSVRHRFFTMLFFFNPQLFEVLCENLTSSEVNNMFTEYLVGKADILKLNGNIIEKKMSCTSTTYCLNNLLISSTIASPMRTSAVLLIVVSNFSCKDATHILKMCHFAYYT